jgi:hypothetical protein
MRQYAASPGMENRLFAAHLKNAQAEVVPSAPSPARKEMRVTRRSYMVAALPAVRRPGACAAATTVMPVTSHQPAAGAEVFRKERVVQKRGAREARLPGARASS